MHKLFIASSLVHLEMVKERGLTYGSVDSPQKGIEVIRDIAAGLICNMDRECMVVCATDIKMHPVCMQIIGIGTINTCTFSIPDIFKSAIIANSSYILLFHNHPSGDPAPSQYDITCTRRVRSAGELLGIELRDHIIIGQHDSYFSFYEANMLTE